MIPIEPSAWAPAVRARAEQPALGEYLLATLQPEERRRMGFISFNQWDFTTAALADTALAAADVGIECTVAFWADHTPLPDPGWTCSHTVARLTGTSTRDQKARHALQRAGFTPAMFAGPPMRHWRAQGLPAMPRQLTRAAIRAMTYRGSDMGRSILQVHPDFNTPVRDDYVWPRRWIRSAMRSYAWAYDQTRSLIQERDLGSIVVYNGRFTHDRAAAAAAESLGTRVLYYDAGGIDTGFDLTTSTTHDWVDLQRRMLRLYEEWDPLDRDAVAESWFLNRQAHAEPGLDVFVGSQTRGYLGELPAGDLLVVFFSSSGDEIAELDLDWSQYLGSQEKALAALADECRGRPGTRLVVRTHPHMRLKPEDDRRRWTAVVESAGPDVHFDAGSPVDSYALMREADIVFTYGSTAGVESAYVGKPVVVMGPSAYDLIGCAARITSTAEIEASLADPPAPNPQAALAYGLMMQRRGFNYERVRREPGRALQIDDSDVSDAGDLALKISHAMNAARTRWLTSR